MPKMEFFVGPGIEITALDQYRSLLNTAYENGEKNGGSMDWNDVQCALDKAIEALGSGAEDFMKKAEAGGIDEDEAGIFFMPGTDVTNVVMSATKLVWAYRYPENVKWEDVDDAWNLLSVNKALTP